jgi:hypothetical protein
MTDMEKQSIQQPEFNNIGYVIRFASEYVPSPEASEFARRKMAMAIENMEGSVIPYEYLHLFMKGKPEK